MPFNSKSVPQHVHDSRLDCCCRSRQTGMGNHKAGFKNMSKQNLVLAGLGLREQHVSKRQMIKMNITIMILCLHLTHTSAP